MSLELGHIYICMCLLCNQSKVYILRKARYFSTSQASKKCVMHLCKKIPSLTFSLKHVQM